MGGRPVQSGQAAPPQQVVKGSQSAPGQKACGRHVQGGGQGHARADQTLKVLTVVFRHVTAEIRGHVQQHGAGGKVSLIEGQGVQKGFQGGARRASGQGVVHLPLAGRVPEIGRTRIGQNFPGAGMEHHHCYGPDGRAAQLLQATCNGGLHNALHPFVQTAPQHCLFRQTGTQPAAEMRRGLGHGGPRGQQRAALAFGNARLAEHTVSCEALQYLVAHLQGRLGIFQRIVARGRARQH